MDTNCHIPFWQSTFGQMPQRGCWAVPVCFFKVEGFKHHIHIQMGAFPPYSEEQAKHTNNPPTPAKSPRATLTDF
ncbi:hypothetical protein ASY01nite_14570 [Acetobacter syzygii]|nr:hypothetical protein Absy_019_013 [Acetobacter syzygii]GBR65038.1 hypothetical protein AA0483_1660 [Acetobacter syzygii NRIC 0483]GEL56391.1 hypothetical protein ASY01nite_14570 [Acetobacter syzygii]